MRDVGEERRREDALFNERRDEGGESGVVMQGEKRRIGTGMVILLLVN